MQPAAAPILTPAGGGLFPTERALRDGHESTGRFMAREPEYGVIK